MDKEAGAGKTVAFLRSRAKLPRLYRRPGDVSAVSAEGWDIREGIFVAWSSAYLYHGGAECGDAPGVFAAGVRAQQPGADKALCAVNPIKPVRRNTSGPWPGPKGGTGWFYRQS